MSTKIFVGSLPSGSKPEELRHLFEAFGVVTECDVMNRCGFVHMENPEMAANAIKALNGTEFKGETINVEPGRIRDRNQKPGGIGGAKGGGPRPRGGRNGNAMLMQNFDGMDDVVMNLDGIDERTTKDALQLCSAVFEEMNKLLNPDQMVGPRRGGGGMGFPPNFIEDQLGAVLAGGMAGPKGPMNRGPRNNRNNGPPKQASFPNAGPIQAPINRPPNKNVNAAPRGVPTNQGNINRSGPQVRGPNQGNAGRVQNQGNQGFAGRNQNQNPGNVGRSPKQGNVGPIRNEPTRQRAAAPYNRGAPGPIDNEINFADDVPIVQSARNFANSLATGSQIDRWPENNGNFGGNGGMNRHPMNRNFDEDMPVDNFTDDAPIVINLVTRPSGAGAVGGNSGRRGGMGNQGPVNQGNFGRNTGGGNARFQGSNDRFQGGNDRFQGGSHNDRFQNNNNNDRFQGGSGSGNFGNQDRRGFILPEKQVFNDSPKFGNQDVRGGGNFGGPNNLGGMGGGNRNVGFGNNADRQQNAPESRNIGGGNMGVNAGNAMFTRRNNSGGNLDGNNMGNNRMRNDIPNTNRGGNFGGNNNRGMGTGGGGGNMNNNAGFNRDSKMGAGNINLDGPIAGINRNMGGGNAPINRNMGGGLGNNNNRNMGGGVGNNNNRNMGGGMGNNNNRNMGGGMGNNRNMGGGVGNNNRNMDGNAGRNNMGGGNQMNPMNFQKDFPALSGGQNMNNRTPNGGDWRMWTA